MKMTTLLHYGCYGVLGLLLGMNDLYPSTFGFWGIILSALAIEHNARHDTLMDLLTYLEEHFSDEEDEEEESEEESEVEGEEEEEEEEEEDV